MSVPYDTCTCGRRKQVRNAQCGTCTYAPKKKARQQALYAAKVQAAREGHRCGTCAVPMRHKEWRGEKFLRCPSCGLEIKGLPPYFVPDYDLNTEEAAA